MKKKNNRRAGRITDLSAVLILLGGIGLWLLWPKSVSSPDFSGRTADKHLSPVFYETEREMLEYAKPDAFIASPSAGFVFHDDEELMPQVTLPSFMQSFALLPPVLVSEDSMHTGLSFAAAAPADGRPELMPLPLPHRFGSVSGGALSLMFDYGPVLERYHYMIEPFDTTADITGRVWQVRASVEFDQHGNVCAVFLERPHSDAVINRFVEGLLYRGRLQEMPEMDVSGTVVIACTRGR